MSAGIPVQFPMTKVVSIRNYPLLPHQCIAGATILSTHSRMKGKVILVTDRLGAVVIRTTYFEISPYKASNLTL